MNQTFESRMCDFVFLAELDEFGASNAIAIAREMDAREAALRKELAEAKAALAAKGVEIADAARILQMALDDEECANGNASGALDISTITAAKAFIARAALAPRVPAGEVKP